MMANLQGESGSSTVTSIFRRIPSVRERSRRSSLGQVSGGVAIHDAIGKGKIHLAKFILDAVEGGSVVNSRDSLGQTPLIKAVIGLDDTGIRMRALALLIQHGANVNHRDSYGRTALSYAAEARRSDAIKVLVKNNVDPNIDDSSGNTPLMYCAMVNNTEGMAIIIKSFRRLGLDIDKMNNDGQSALIVAAKNCFMECVKLLVAEGRASLDQRDKIRNMTAAEWAREGGCSIIDMDMFLPRIHRQFRTSNSTPSTPNREPRAILRKHESVDSNCSSKDGYSAHSNSSRNSSREDLSHKVDCPSGLIAVPTPPTYRRSTQPHNMEALSRRFHALQPIKNINDIPAMKPDTSEMKRASLPEVTDAYVMKIHCDNDAVNLNRESTGRPTAAVFVKRTKPSGVQRRPLSAINRNSNNRQSKSFDEVTYDCGSTENIRAKEYMSKSHSMNFLGSNLLNLTFVSRSTEALSPIRSRSNCAHHGDQETFALPVNSANEVKVNVDSDHRVTHGRSSGNVKNGIGGQAELSTRLPPLTPKHSSKGD